MVWEAFDEVKVTILKETGSGSVVKTEEVEGADKSSSWFRWGSKGSGASSAGGLESQRAQEQFRKNMQSFSLYGEEGAAPTTTTTTTTKTAVKEEVDHPKEMAPRVEEPETKKHSELQITRDKLQIMQDQTRDIADEVAGDVFNESATEEEEETSIDDSKSINEDVACAAADSTTASKKTSIQSDRNEEDSKNAE